MCVVHSNHRHKLSIYSTYIFFFRSIGTEEESKIHLEIIFQLRKINDCGAESVSRRCVCVCERERARARDFFPLLHETGFLLFAAFQHLLDCVCVSVYTFVLNFIFHLKNR